MLEVGGPADPRAGFLPAAGLFGTCLLAGGDTRKMRDESNAGLIERIHRLKQKRNAIILAHNYQPGNIQEIADFVGDSLGLSQKAAESDADVIVFCGVDFMAETAAVLSPEKLVLLPEKEATCPMAHMATAEEVRIKKSKRPKSVVVTYVNSTAAVKAQSDICCTSANAISVIKSIEEDKEIIFVPDMHLGEYSARKTGRKLVLWEGFCPTHHWVTAEEILAAKARWPSAVVLAHPECPTEVVDLADAALSTSGMLKYAKNSNASEFIIVTEVGMLYPLSKQNPTKKFYCPSAALICPNMKRITLQSVRRALEEDTYPVRLPDNIARRAKVPIERMLTVPRD